MLFTVSLAVFSVSLVFSMMGAGGSQILVPLLYWLGMDFKAAAIPLGLLTSAVTCFSAGFVYYRRGLVRVTTAYPFALAVLAGSPLGAALARPASSRALMVAFAAVNILVGLLVLRRRGMTREIRRGGEMALALAMGLG
ncbi:MAG: sulfite exporter TauE/SafE family protein, partial [Candidatus Geothermincolales bacterium]